MKRLRKFNENVSQIDYIFIYDCFAELIDDDKAEIKKIEKIKKDSESKILRILNKFEKKTT